MFKVFPENPIIGDILDLRAMVKGTRSSLLDQFLRSKSQGVPDEGKLRTALNNTPASLI